MDKGLMYEKEKRISRGKSNQLRQKEWYERNKEKISAMKKAEYISVKGLCDLPGIDTSRSKYVSFQRKPTTYDKEAYLRHREKRLLYAKKYYRKNLEKILAYRKIKSAEYKLVRKKIKEKLHGRRK